MSDTVELIVTLSKGQYENLKNIQCGSIGSRMIVNAVMNGTPLPKGHGRLIEVNESLYQSIRDWCGTDTAYEILHNAPTIIEADNERD